MKANELRIGNLVKDINNNVFCISHEKLCDFANGYINLFPVKLTYGYLMKFGFIEVPKKDRIFIKRYGIEFEFSNSGNIYYKKLLIPYVHNFQNLYFALKNEELKFNQDA